MVTSQPILRYVLQSLSAIAVLFTLTGCGSLSSGSAVNATESTSSQLAMNSTQAEFSSLVNSANVKSRILDHYSSWKGVRYRLGGTTKKGVDCSSFVQIAFREQFGLTLPRSTAMQQNSGQPIQRDKLSPGDLVLFRSGSTGRHIGIYIGNDNFVHASTSSGVMISSLNDAYWKTRYQQARRVLSTS